MGILVTAASAMVLAIFFDLSAIASIGSAVALVVFALTTLVEEPVTAVALVAILLLGVVLDLWWKSRRGSPA